MCPKCKGSALIVESLTIADDTLLRPNLANSFSVNYSRWIGPTTGMPLNLFPVQIPGWYGPGFPQVNFTFTYGANYGDQNAGYGDDPFWHISEAISWTKGTHSFKFGARYSDYIQQATNGIGKENGAYFFRHWKPGTDKPAKD